MASTQDTPLASNPWTDTPTVYFIIPLYGREMAHDWDQVLRNLDDTLQSLLRQTSGAWKAMICSQTRPDTLPDDPRIVFEPFDGPEAERAKTEAAFDNAGKKQRMIARLCREETGQGYLFQLDADDILHPELVEYICRDNNGTGYVIRDGYICHAHTFRMGHLREQSLLHPFAKPFYKQCGSCAALRFDPKADDAGMAHIQNRGAHKNLPETMASYGYPLAPVPFPAALYMIAHGENMRQRRGKLGGKLRYLRLNRLSKRKSAQIAQSFGVGA